MGFSKQEYWSGLLYPPPWALPDPGIEPRSLMPPAMAGRFLTTSTTWEAPLNVHIPIYVYAFEDRSDPGDQRARFCWIVSPFLPFLTYQAYLLPMYSWKYHNCLFSVLTLWVSPSMHPYSFLSSCPPSFPTSQNLSVAYLFLQNSFYAHYQLYPLVISLQLACPTIFPIFCLMRVVATQSCPPLCNAMDYIAH